jgi:hypothetical protein
MTNGDNPMIPIHHATLETLHVHLSRSHEDYADMADKVMDLTEANERLRALLREAWMLTGGDQSPTYLQEFHDRLDAQAHALGLRLPR